MIPQVSDILDRARFHLGDTRLSGGQLFTDAFLQNGHFPAAYEALYRYLARCNAKRLRRTVYYNLPANTSYLTPAGMGLPNLSRPEAIWDRSIQTTISPVVSVVNAVAPGVPPSVDLMYNNHGYLAGQEVVTFGFGMTPGTIDDSANGSFYIGVPDVNTIRLLGCPALDQGAAVGSGGILSTGSEVFPVDPLWQLFDFVDWQLSAQNSQLSNWKWDEGAFHFIPANTNRQIRVTFMISGAAPPSGSVYIDDSLDALALFTAASAASAKAPSKSTMSSLSIRAVGNPNLDSMRVMGGAFYELAQLGTQAIQMTRVVMPRWRPRRNMGPYPYSSIPR